jgi:hypothetical protein
LEDVPEERLIHDSDSSQLPVFFAKAKSGMPAEIRFDSNRARI